MDPFTLRTQLERNNADLEQYSKEITEWCKEMKKKEVGHKEKKKKEPKKNEKQEEVATSSMEMQRHGRGDYAAWDKYDADKECEKLDNEKSISTADYDDVSDETDDENIEESIIEKDKGNNFFKANDYKNAIKSYNKAIDLFAYNPIYFANRAMCYLKLKNYQKAESDCSLALALDKKYVKAYQRRAIARENLNRLAEAKEDVLRVFDFEPSNKEFKEVLKRIESKMKKTSKPVSKTEATNIETPSKHQDEQLQDFCRPKSKFALSRQQNTDTKASYSPLNLVQPISDKIVERKLDSPSTSKENKIDLHEIKPPPNSALTSVQEMFFKWPAHDEEVLKEYSAIKKPPKGRSQSVLKKITVTETESTKKSANITTPSQIDETSNKPNERIVKVAAKHECESYEENSDELDVAIFREVPSDDFAKLINRPVPKTSVQFYYNWKELDSELKYLFLLQIHPREFANIFKDSLESSYFSAILKVMAEEFIVRNKTVVPHLYGLSKVKRFSTLTMFKTAEDISVLEVLIDNAQKDVDLSKFTDVLKKRYEMV